MRCWEVCAGISQEPPAQVAASASPAMVNEGDATGVVAAGPLSPPVIVLRS
jgi:hypothetical protein